MAQREYQKRMQRIARRQRREEWIWNSWLGRLLHRRMIAKMPPMPPPGGGAAGVREPRRPAPAPPSLRAALDE